MEKQHKEHRFDPAQFAALAERLHVPHEVYSACQRTDFVNCKFASSGACLTHKPRPHRKSSAPHSKAPHVPQKFTYAHLPTIPDHEKAGAWDHSKKTHLGFHNSMAPRFASVNISRDSIAWFEFENKRRFAVWPVAKLRQAARRAGFHSSAEFLASEHRKSA